MIIKHTLGALYKNSLYKCQVNKTKAREITILYDYPFRD